MAVTLAVYIGIQILVPTAIRPNLLPSTTVAFPVNETTASQATGIYTTGGGSDFYIAGLPVPQGAWVISAPPVEDSSGQVVAAGSHSDCFGFARTPGPTKGGGPGVDKIAACLARYDRHQSVTYQPAQLLLAAPVVRNRDLPRARRGAVMYLLLVDPTPTELTGSTGCMSTSLRTQYATPSLIAPSPTAATTRPAIPGERSPVPRVRNPSGHT